MTEGKDIDKVINANPTKEFFISMLTRDIDLQPAIAELVDNSLDGAKKFRCSSSIPCSIEIKFSKDEFSIKDTCGGMSIDEAKNYCFRFGRPSDKNEENRVKTIGVFGIGMKRALFRLGKSFHIKSITKTESFTVDVDVDEWVSKNDVDWSFNFTDMRRNEENCDEECGTEITVTKLYPTISASFSNPYFISNFIEYIKIRSSTLKELNVSMVVNKENIEYADEKIIFDDEFIPFVKNYMLDNVNIRIMAACARMGQPKKSGWYVFCNGRMVLCADQSEITGWGTNSIPLHHASHAAFRGYVFFESEDLNKLPWNTMKTGVDTSSKYFRSALAEMNKATKEFIVFRNRLDEVIQSNESLSLEAIFERREISIFDPEIINFQKSNHEYSFPNDFQPPEKPLTNVSFKIEKERAELAKEYFLEKTNGKMGRKVFDYFYEREIEDDE